MTRASHIITFATAVWVTLLSIAVVWAVDREPPFAVLKYVTPDPVRAGQQQVFVMPVIRDIERNCDVHFTRYLLDGAGIRYDYASEPRKVGSDPRVQMMSAKGLADMDARMGPWLRVAVVVPTGATPGKASLGTELEYQCNPLHAWWPVRVSLSFPFEILPP